MQDLKAGNDLPALIEAVESVKDCPVAVQDEIAHNFTDFFRRIEIYCNPAFALVVENESEKEKMFDAGQAVVALKGLEKAITAKHGEMKHDALKYSQALDATKRAALALITPAVEHLKAQSEYIERKEAARIESLRSERYALILPYLVPEILPTPWPEWGTMHEEDFAATLAAAKEKARQITLEAIARIEKEQAEREELERLRVENEKQAREIEEARQARYDAEQRSIAAQREAERETAIAKQAAERAEHDAKQAIANHFKDYGKPVDQILAETKETAQTDREKLRAYGAALLQVPCAPIQDPAMREVLQDVKILLTKVNDHIEKKIAIQ